MASSGRRRAAARRQLHASATATESRSSARTASARARCCGLIAGETTDQRNHLDRRPARRDAPARRAAVERDRARPDGVAGPAAAAARRGSARRGRGRRRRRADALRHGTRRMGRRRRIRRRGLLGCVLHRADRRTVRRDRATAPLRTFSGGEQKRLALEALLRSDFDVLLLDEPDNFLDVPGKRWLEDELRATPQDDAVRQPRPRAAGRHRDQGRHRRGQRSLDAWRWIRRLPRGPSGAPGNGASTTSALYEDERKKLEELVVEMRRRAKISDTFAPRLKAAESRLRQFLEKNERPQWSANRRIDMRLGGARRASERWHHGCRARTA